MGLIEIASGNSVWRGMDYYNRKKEKERIGKEFRDGFGAGPFYLLYSLRP